MATGKRFATALATGGLLLSMAVPAVATVVHVGGGTWDYGTGGGKVWSNYYHGSRCHRSSVEGQYYASSGNTRAGAWARASAPDRWYAADHSYYGFC